jgi:hypothetical protein
MSYVLERCQAFCINKKGGLRQVWYTWYKSNVSCKTPSDIWTVACANALHVPKVFIISSSEKLEKNLVYWGSPFKCWPLMIDEAMSKLSSNNCDSDILCV